MSVVDLSEFYGNVNGIEVERGYETGGAPFVHTKEIVGKRYYKVRFKSGGMGNSVFLDEDLNVLHDDSEDSDVFDIDLVEPARTIVRFMFDEVFPPSNDG